MPNEAKPRVIRTPPFLLGAALLFWGWESGLLIAGIVMAVVLEGARLVRVRWDLGEADFRRIAYFCELLGLAVALYAFSQNEGPGGISGMLHGSAALHNASLTTALTGLAFLRWLPLVFFLAVAAQVYSVTETLPLTAISPFLRRYRERELKAGRPLPPMRYVNFTYPYLILCLFSAGLHTNEGADSFFWGQAVLVGWALWPFRSARFQFLAWALAFLLVVAFGFETQLGIRVMQQRMQSYPMRWLSYFLRPRTDPMQMATSIGQIGELKLSGNIVIRLWPAAGQPPPMYLREASYRVYGSPQAQWGAGSPRTAFENGPVYAESNQTTFILIPGKTNTAAVNIACYLNGRSRNGNSTGLLPLPSGAGRLDNLNAYILEKNPEGAVLVAEGPGLVVFDAAYGPGATVDSPPGTGRITNMDYSVPTNEVPALEQVIADNHLRGNDEPQTLRNVQAFFEKNFTYSTWQGPDKLATNDLTPISRFLLTSRSGHCEYFATATVLLLRELRIPARYAVGYAVHEPSGSGYVVRQRDGHAWCLAWDEQAQTWVDFDTTPGSWINIEGQRSSFWEKLSDLKSWIGFQVAKLRWGQSHLRDYILWGLMPVLILLLYQIIFRYGRKKRRQQPLERIERFAWPGLDSEFYRLEQKLSQRGVPRRPGEPLSDWLERALADAALADLRAPLADLLHLHYRYRFDPQGLSADERERLTEKAKSCLYALSNRPGNRENIVTTAK